MAAPRPVVTLTLIPPIILHTAMYQSMLFVPYLDLVEIQKRKGKHKDELGSEVEDYNERDRYEHRYIRQEAWSEKEFLKLPDLANGVFLGTWRIYEYETPVPQEGNCSHRGGQ